MRRLLLLALLAVTLPVRSYAAAEDLPAKLGDTEFWQLISDLSEPNGYFRFENFLSNEGSFQQVIPDLKAKTKPGGVYLGVGPEQNFTYIAALRPKMAFIVDIRRQNMLEHLMYKALFDLSDDRADFVSALFSRKRPAGLNSQSSAEDLFRLYARAVPDTKLFQENWQAILNDLTQRHRFPLTTEDQNGIKYVYSAFFRAGPDLDYGIGGFGGGMPTYADLMVETDGKGAAHGYLASENDFRAVKSLERDNMLVPVTGDFAGPKAIREIGRYLHAHDAPVTAFYLSNVERYLFEDGAAWRRFYVNAAILPYDSSSQFVRAVLNGIGYRRAQRFGFWSDTLLCPISDLMKAFSAGKINGYEDVVEMSR